MEKKDKLVISGRIGLVVKILAAPPALPKRNRGKAKVQSPTNFESSMEKKDELVISGRIGRVVKISAAPPALPKKSWKSQSPITN